MRRDRPRVALAIRSFREGDAAAVTALWEEMFPDDRPWSSPARYLERKRIVQPELLLVGAVDDRVVATVAGGYDGVRGWIYHLAVAPALRRQGFGTVMMAEAETRLAALGCPKVNLQVLARNAQVVQFYRSIGYAAEERISMGKVLVANPLPARR